MHLEWTKVAAAVCDRDRGTVRGWRPWKWETGLQAGLV